LFFITFFSSAIPDFKDENLLRAQPIVILFPFGFLIIFIIIFRIILGKFFRLPHFKHELSVKTYFLVIILSFIIFLIISDIGLYFYSLFHEIGHALSIIEFSPKVYVYLSFPTPSGPYGKPTTKNLKPINLDIPPYRLFIMPLAGVLMEIFVFISSSLIVVRIKWKTEYPNLKRKFKNIKNKLFYFIFPNNVRLEDNTFPLSSDLIRYLFFILISSLFFNWILCLEGSDIVWLYKDIIKWNGYLSIQQFFSNPLVAVITNIIIYSLIIFSLTSLVFHRIDNFITKNKKLPLYTFVAFIFLFVLFLIIHFQWGNIEIGF